MVFVTAEIGSHWQGSFQILEDIIKACMMCGVNAIKFQCLSQEKIKKHLELPYYEESSVNEFNIDKINELCKYYKIEWYATPTIPEHVDLLDPYVNRFKIGAKWSDNRQLCDKVFATGKQVIISSEKPKHFDNKTIKNIYCISKYPTLMPEINFNKLDDFDGYSNHCLNPLAILKAVLLDSQFIEFHLTPSKDYYLLDNKVSFNYLEMGEIMTWVKIYESWNNPSGKTDIQKISKQSSKSLK